MKILSLSAPVVLLFVNMQLFAQDEPQQEAQPAQSTLRDTFDEYTAYLKEELIDTYNGLGELGSDFLTDVSYATAPVSTVIVTGVTELGILAQDGYESLKIELKPVGNLIASARKKLEEFASNLQVHNK